MVKEIGLLVGGAALGAGILLATHSSSHVGEPVESPTATLSGDTDRRSTEAQPQIPTASTRPASKVTPQVNEENTSETAARQTAISTPQKNATAVSSSDSMGRDIDASYRAMIEPRPLPDRLTAPELYESFVDDERDESWAYPMELGINQYIAEHGQNFDTQFEYVECRSRYCTIAGIVHNGDQSTVNEMMGEMTTQGWWQSFAGRSSVGTKTGNVYRFVSIIPRSEEDGLRDKSTIEPTQKGADSALQAAG